MPAFKRIEMLALALESVDQAENSPEDVRVFLDYTTDSKKLDEVEYVRNIYCPRAQIFQAKQHVKAPSGCWNILNAYKQGYESGADFVALVEEDVRVFPSYFTWNQQAQQSGCFATCGRYIQRFGENYFTNPGAQLRRESLALVVPHINDSFFNDRRGYLDKTFSPFPDASDLDDGLIRHVMRSVNGFVKYPETPKVAHQGFRMYCRTEEFRPMGSIERRVHQLRNILKNVDPSWRHTQDFEPFTEG
jgi:hypothetical protein